MEIKMATLNDIDFIMDMVNINKGIMRSEGNTQWDETYPLKQHFESDIKNVELYKICNKDMIMGVICLNETESKEYIDVDWTFDSKALVVHRLCISPDNHKRGIGKIFMEYAEKLAKEKGYKHIKADTYNENKSMNKFLVKCGFKKVGEIYMRNKPEHYNCYEKLI